MLLSARSIMKLLITIFLPKKPHRTWDWDSAFSKPLADPKTYDIVAQRRRRGTIK